jgi:tetratricopeptide (TPR) repeat protein
VTHLGHRLAEEIVIDTTLVAAIGGGLGATTFLVGFASVRLRAHRDRALDRSQDLADDITQAVRESRVLTDGEIQAAATAFKEAVQLDPVSKWTVGLSLVLAAGITTLGTIAIADANYRFIWNPLSWTGGFIGIVFLIMAAWGIAFLGVADLRWVRRDLTRRLDDTLIAHVSRALGHRKAGEYQAAADLATALLHRVPNWPWPFAFRSYCLQHLGKFDEALEDASQAVSIDPDNPWWMLQRARLNSDVANHEEALADLNRVLTMLPGEPAALRLRAMTYDRLGDRAAALADFDSALKRAPRDKDLLLARGQTILESRQEYYNESTPPTVTLVEIMLEEDQRAIIETLRQRDKNAYLNGNLT